MNSSQSFVVLGGGLAGTFLAARLLMEGQKVTLIEDGNLSGASRVAAGMFNVVTGKYALKTWMADTLLASFKEILAHPWLEEAAKEVHFMPIYRPFADVAEYNLWLTQQREADYSDYIRFIPESRYAPQLSDTLGGIEILGCGWINVPTFLQILQKTLVEKGMQFIAAFVPDSQIDLENKYIHLSETETTKTLSFDHLILTQGHRLAQSSLFPLDLSPTKGQIIEIYAPELQLSHVISGPVYILDAGEGRFFVGSTYEWNFADEKPDTAGLAEIEAGLAKILQVPYTVVSHKAGIRPASYDRRPILGTSPTHKNLHVFTGFGTKGVLLAPHFSKVLSDYLLGKGELAAEYSVERLAKRRAKLLEREKTKKRLAGEEI